MNYEWRYIMFEQIKWEDVYTIWKNQRYCLPDLLYQPISAETIFVEYNQEGCIYGYDWLENIEVPKRKQLIEKNPMEFLYFMKPTNKGTIRTAEMLIEARDEEELAAIWIAATAKEFYDRKVGHSVFHYSYMLYLSAREFLKTRYSLWHHAMKKLVPEIIIPFSILENIECKDISPVIGLIQMNTMLLKNSWCILKYTSLEGNKVPCSYHYTHLD